MCLGVQIGFITAIQYLKISLPEMGISHNRSLGNSASYLLLTPILCQRKAVSSPFLGQLSAWVKMMSIVLFLIVTSRSKDCKWVLNKASFPQWFLAVVHFELKLSRFGPISQKGWPKYAGASPQ